MKEEKKKDKKKKSFLENIKKLSNSKRGRAILFFIFYFVFFFLVISLLQRNHSTLDNTNNKENTVRVEYKLDGILSSNYHFVREEVVNGVVTNFTGEREDNKIEGLITRDNTFNSYFIYDDIFLLRNNDKYEIADTLYSFYNITSLVNLEEILKKAMLVSKTDYDGGKSIYNYQITTNTLDNIINDTNIDIADIPNTITLETDSNKEVVKITYDLSSYASYFYQSPSNVIITETYSNFGNVKGLVVPNNS